MLALCVCRKPFLHPCAWKTGLTGYWPAMLWNSMRHDFPISHFLMLFELLSKKQSCKDWCTWSELVSVSFPQTAQVLMCWHCHEETHSKSGGSSRCCSSCPIPRNPSSCLLVRKDKMNYTLTNLCLHSAQSSPFSKLNPFWLSHSWGVACTALVFSPSL